MLVDTSVWIEFLAKRTRALSIADLDRLATALVDGEVTIISPIYAELVSGAHHDDGELRTLLSALRFIDLDWNARASWDQVAALGQTAFKRRLRIPGVVDRMILASAQAGSEALWALDGPLSRLARSLGVPHR